MLCLGFLQPLRLDSKDSSLSSRSLQVLSNIYRHLPGSENMLADALFPTVGVPVVAAPGSCPESSVSLILSVSSGTGAQGLVSPVLSSSVSPTSAQPCSAPEIVF